ncbi:MAG: helix-turn-helix domain-containing protein [Opitutaceae bacterium]|jgi:transcriptional regulator with XRE-family HTH domain
MQTIGERLEEARKRKGISIREAAEGTKIRGDYLQKFENNQFDLDISEIYVRGFLRTYSAYLKLPPERIVSDYRALAGAESDDSRPRSPSREVYGRMDLSIASLSGGKTKDSTLAPVEPAPGVAEPQESRPRTFARIGTSLPHGPAIEGRLLIKIGCIALGLLFLVLIIWGIKSMAGGSAEAKSQQSAASAAVEPSIGLIAIDTVRVKVVQESDSKELFQGTLIRGETRSVPRRGPLLITYSEGKNLEVEYSGKRHSMPTTGYDRARIP